MTSPVQICNHALQKLGARRIVSLDDLGVVNAARCKAAYAIIRDQELRKRAWSFAIRRATLPADATPPAFGYSNAFPVPSDYLRWLPSRETRYWAFEDNKILTNDAAPLQIRYIARVEDSTTFDTLFAESLSCAIADHLCEEVTGSRALGDRLAEEYKKVVAEARMMNAFEQEPEEPPEDDWIAARL